MPFIGLSVLLVKVSGGSYRPSPDAPCLGSAAYDWDADHSPPEKGTGPMLLWHRIVRIWLPIAVATTVVCGLIAVTGQQIYRNGLDDPQIQLAHDTAARLDAGAAPASVVNSPTVDARASLAPFLIVYSPTNAVLAAGATLDGATPIPPAGVLQTARDLENPARRSTVASRRRASGDNRVTWQPREGVRLASVSVGAKNGVVVLAARNMREVEDRESQLDLLVAIGWFAAIAAILLTSIVIELSGGRGGAERGIGA
jgi:hypothetical protein